jgi:hypothetical protein
MKFFARFIDAVEDAWFLLRFGGVGGLNRADRRAVRTTIKRLEALKREGVYVYGATNRLRAKGSPISIVLTAGGVTAGSVGCASSAATMGLFGIAESAKDTNNTAVLHMEGVWLLPSFTVVTSIAVGDPIYVIPGTGVLTQTAASNMLFARSLVALGAGAAQVTAKLVGSN